MTTDPSWTDIGAFVVLAAQLFVISAAAVVAWRQVREARRLREQQIRPFVIVDFEFERGFVFLVIENIGTTLARNVRVTFSPGLSSALDVVKLPKLKMFRDGIATLAPGRRIRMLFDFGPQRKEAGLPDEYLAVVEYEDESGRGRRDPIDLDLGIYWDLVRVDRKDIDDIHKRLEEISKTLRGWNASGGGILRVSPNEQRERFEEFERRHRERARHPEPEEPSDLEGGA